MPELVNVVAPDGNTIAVPPDQVESLTLQGYRLQTPVESDEAAHQRAEAEAYSGFGNKVAAGFLGAARMFTGGLSDQYFGAVGGDSTREDLAKLQEHQPGATLVGEIGGAIAGPGKVAGAAGKAVRGASNRAARKVVAHGVEGAVEGGLYSLGQTVSQAAISDDPLTVEKIASNVPLGAALGGGVGAMFGVGALAAGAVRKKLAGEANPLLHARSTEAKEMAQRLGGELKKVDDELVRGRPFAEARARRGRELANEFMAGRANAPTRIDNVAEHRAALHKAAAEAEKRAAKLEAQAQKAKDKAAREEAKAAAQAARAEAKALAAAGREAEQFLKKAPDVPGAAPTRVMDMSEEMAAVAARGDEIVPSPPLARSDDAPLGGRQIGADAPTGQIRVKSPHLHAEGPEPELARGTPARSPGADPDDAAHWINEADQRAAAEVNEMRQAFDGVRKRIIKTVGDDWSISWPALVRKRPQEAVRLFNDIDEYLGIASKLGKLTGRDLTGHLGSADDLLARIAQGTPSAEKAAESLKALGDRASLAEVLGVDIGDLPKSPASEALVKMYAMSRTAETAAARRATVVMGEEDSFRAQVMGMLGQQAQGRLWRAVGNVLGAPGLSMMSLAGQVGKATRKIAEGAAAAVEKGTTAARRPAVLTASAILSEVRFSPDEDVTEKDIVKRRAKELDELMSNPARLEALVDDATAPLRAHNLNLGYGVGDHLKKRVAYYHQFAPKAPVTPSPLVRSRWKPAPGESYEFAVRIRAGENPFVLLNDLMTGRLHPAAVETAEALWPEVYAEMQSRLVEEMTQLREELPYQKRLQLSILFKVPVEQTTDPEFVKTLQDMYAARREEEQQPPSRGPGGAPPAPPATKGQMLEAR